MRPKSSKKTKTKSLAHKSQFSKASLLAFLLIFGAVGGYIIWRSFAAPPAAPTVYLTPSSNVFGTNSSFSVQIRENSGASTVNAVSAYLSYPSSMLTLVSIDGTSSAFSVSAESTPPTGTSNGVINITRGTCLGCAVVSGDQLVATLNFKTNTTGGAAAVAFTTGTALVSSTSNTNLLPSLSSTGGGSFTIDTNPPNSVSITNPSNPSTLAAGSVVNISVSASDAESAISKVELYIDGSGSPTVTLNSSPYTYAWNTTGLSLGSHTIKAKAYDTFNNVASSGLTTVTLADQTAPSTPGSFRSTTSTTTTISLAWNASTDNVGVTSYKISRAGSVIATISPPTVSYIDSSGLVPGTAYSYSIQAFDAAGNASSPATLNASTVVLKPGDLNSDGVVDGSDLAVLLANFKTTFSGADINHDGIVDVLDLSTLLSHVGT